MEFNFEEFTKSGSRFNTYYVGITTSGSMSFYAGFYQRENIANYGYALLMYDKDKEVVGIKFGSKEELGKGAQKLNHTEQKNNAWISAGNFFNFYRLDSKKLKGKYVPKIYENETKGKIFYIELRKDS